MNSKELTNGISVDPILILCAVRYALPRQSYISPTIAREVARISADLNENDRIVILRNIAADIREFHLMRSDLAAWQSAVDALLRDASEDTQAELESDPKWSATLTCRPALNASPEGTF